MVEFQYVPIAYHDYYQQPRFCNVNQKASYHSRMPDGQKQRDVRLAILHEEVEKGISGEKSFKMLLDLLLTEI